MIRKHDEACKTCEWYLMYYEWEHEGACELTNIMVSEDCWCKYYSRDKGAG